MQTGSPLRVAIVTGAAAGLGQAIARRLAGDGYAVLLADVVEGALAETERELAEAGATVRSVVCDVSDEAQVEALVDAAVTWGGSLDVLVNNAGVNSPGGVLDCTPEQWRRVMDVNLHGVFLGLRAAAGRMREQGHGTIVNVSSVSGYRASSVPQAAYDVSKAAVRMLTVSAAVELAPHGIRVNAVAPGACSTDMVRNALNTPERLDASVARIPMGRLGDPSEVADAVAYLASDASTYVNGHTLVVDGGRLAM